MIPERSTPVSCLSCGETFDADPTYRDVSGNCYCTSCFAELCIPVAQRTVVAVRPLFQCTTCGNRVGPPEIVELNGRLACRHCLSPVREAGATAPRVDAPVPSAERAPAEIVACLEGGFPEQLLHRVTCLHCWHVFPPEQVLWVSEHIDLLGDPVLGRAQLRFRPSRFTACGDGVDSRDMPCQLLACPRCHLTVPRSITETEPLFISIVGAPASGKSHFLAVMTWQLRRLLPARFGVTINDADTLTNHSLNEYESTLFLSSDGGRPVSIRKTELHGALYDQIQLGAHAISLPKPFVFTLRPGSPAEGAPDRRVRVICLYDNAGEHFRPGMDSASSPGTQHLARSGVILFLFDPTQHPGFRQLCRKVSQDPQLSAVVQNERQEVLLTEAASRVRRHTGLSTQERHDRPLLVVVSKADIWGPMVGLPLCASHC